MATKAELRAIARMQDDADTAESIASDARTMASELRKIARRRARQKYGGDRVGAMARYIAEDLTFVAGYSRRLSRALNAEARRRWKQR
jgi:predicted phage gp36 major capsid-like protein